MSRPQAPGGLGGQQVQGVPGASETKQGGQAGGLWGGACRALTAPDLEGSGRNQMSL